jgi:phage terminase large subunit-like protein
LAHVQGCPINSVVADRFKQAEVGEALAAEGVTAPTVWRGMGWKDGAEDVRRFQRAVADQRIATSESLLMRSALGDAVIALDESGNGKLARARSTGRIDPAAAATLAVAEGQRQAARSVRKAREPIWI